MSDDLALPAARTPSGKLLRALALNGLPPERWRIALALIGELDAAAWERTAEGREAA